MRPELKQVSLRAPFTRFSGRCFELLFRPDFPAHHTLLRLWLQRRAQARESIESVRLRHTRATRGGESRVFLTAYGQTTETNPINCARWVGLSRGEQRERHRAGTQAELRQATGAIPEYADSHFGAFCGAAGRADGQ